MAREAFPYPAHPLTDWRPLIINAALTGIATSREQTPSVPFTAEEIAADARACVDAGASILHLHARDGQGRPAAGAAAYAPIIAAVRDRCPEAIVCLTTSGRAASSVEERLAVIDLGPDMASLTLGSHNFHAGPSVNPIATIEELAAAMRDAGVRPELEVFDLGMVHLLHRLIARGLVELPLYVNLMLGFPNGAPADARSLVTLVQALPAGTVWAAAGFGAYQRPVAMLAAASGGGVRTGLEDNPFLDHLTREPATNPGAVEEVAGLAAALGRPVATPDQVRSLLGISSSERAVH